MYGQVATAVLDGHGRIGINIVPGLTIAQYLKDKNALTHLLCTSEELSGIPDVIIQLIASYAEENQTFILNLREKAHLPDDYG